MRAFLLIFLTIYFTYSCAADVRQDIDAKRQGIDYLDKKGLELSREFIRMDSNYYVGWMYEACARYDRAQDKFGYTIAAQVFEKALSKLEKDYKKSLKVNSSDIMALLEAYPRQLDYTYMLSNLYTCYLSLEQSEKAYKLCKRALSKKMMNYFYFSVPYNHLSWIAHRSRTQGSKNHLFLKDDVIQNERLALRYCDSSIQLINKNYSANASLFGDASVSNMYLSSYFYKSLVYTYLAISDSAEFFYNKLKETPHFSHNNYAYLKIVDGDFKNAEKEFLIEKENYDPSEKRTNEFNYMLSILNIYKGEPNLDVDSLPNYIQNRGEVPGFGWDNLALARSCYYAGEHKKAKQYLSKAASFQELNVNVSWAPEQYNYAISLLEYLNSEREIQLIKFNNKGWWYNIPTLLELPKLYIKKKSNSYKLTADFALNKEREYAFYQLFNSECLITFDEIWKTIDGYNTDFFIKKYEEYLKLKNREGVRRFYYYFLARLHYKNADLDQSMKNLDMVLKDPYKGRSDEGLLDARIAELKAMIYRDQKDEKQYEYFRNTLYETYPSLLMYSDLDKKFKINTNGHKSAALDSLISELKTTGVTIVDENDASVICPVIDINLAENKLLKFIVRSSGLKIAEGSVILKENSGRVLAHRIFSVETDEVEVYGKNNYGIISAILAIVVILWLVYYFRKRRTVL